MKTYKIFEDGIEYDIKEYFNGNKYWRYKGYIHRENGPAIEWSNKYKAWYKHGKCHREDGPAVIFDSGNIEYWLHGIHYPDITSIDELTIINIIT